MLEQSVFLLKLSLLFYLISLISYTYIIYRRTNFIDTTAQLFAVGGIIAQILSIILRGLVVHRLPVANVYEFIVLFSLCMALMFIGIQRKSQSPYLAAAILLVIIIINTTASRMPLNTSPLSPALQSSWLQFHVMTAILAYGSFGVAFVMAVIYLVVSRRRSPKGSVELSDLDIRIFKIILIGYTFMSLVLFTGAIWAEQVWGSWWSWDPKETWALITWLIYTLYIHLRVTMGHRGRKSAWVVAIGFLAVMFTLFGVTWLLPGLHSYV